MLGNFPNMTFSPRYSPDANKVVMSLENGGNSDIYVMDLRNRAVTRLTCESVVIRRRNSVSVAPQSSATGVFSCFSFLKHSFLPST